MNTIGKKKHFATITGIKRGDTPEDDKDIVTNEILSQLPNTVPAVSLEVKGDVMLYLLSKYTRDGNFVEFVEDWANQAGLDVVYDREVDTFRFTTQKSLLLSSCDYEDASAFAREGKRPAS